MIDPEKRKAIYLLHREGMEIRGISRRLKVSRNTVRSIIEQKGEIPVMTRKDKIELEPALVHRLYSECDGWVQRIHEKLTEEEGINVGYSTLTGIIRELGLGQSKNERSDQVPDVPGAEMQHDTSPYNLKFRDRGVKVVGSLLYYRYCKLRYLKFYRSFDRFKMKCFFHEGLTFWEYSADDCIIDNTSLARLRGTGKNAVIVPEMEQFARQYGFKFVCHEKGHANRKAGNERSFFTVETNFFPGRTFENLEDLNKQAFDWATRRMANRPVSKTGLIPAQAFEYEKAYLNRLPPYITPPYLFLDRGTDQYGYAPVDGNFYWVPGTKRFNVKVLQFSDHIQIYHKRILLARYDLPPDGVKNEKFWPEGYPPPPKQPKNRKRPTAQEEKKLRAASEQVNAYLDFALKPMGREKHRFIRGLYGLYQKIALPLFIKTIKRALKYRITDMETIERIALLLIREGNYDMPSVQIDSEFENRESYLEGRFTDEVDLSVYDKMMEDDEEDQDG
jgi:transposase